ncbi:MAG: long-chain fatty acid--CoA ligase [Hyphomicrobiaceae bacterium]|nr:MAG: long-chain fatty acid--CoA ligase [Hyphomicrobiaceae bacterium]
MTVETARATEQFDTIPKLLLRNAAQYADRPAIRHKDYGIWQTWTWARVHDEVRAFAIGLRKLGFERGDTVAIIGDNRPRLYATFTAVQSLGGVPVPVYQDSVADEMAYVLEHAEVKMAVVEDQEQVDKIISAAERLPKLQRIIYDDPSGLKDYDHSSLHSFEDVERLGQEEMRKNAGAAGWWLDEIAKGRGADVSVMLYTSGTTGRPKGVMLTHENIVVSGQNGNKFDNFTADDTLLAYLPMAWVGDHIFSYGQAFAGAMCIACPESPETVVEDRREIGPTYFFAPPRVFENLLTQIMVRMEDASRFKKGMFDYFLSVARRCGEQILDGRPVGIKDRLLYRLGDLLVYAPLRNRMGFSNLRVAYTAGEAIGPELFRFYRSLGINLKQLYGQTEASVYITLQPDGEVFPETVGKPGPDVQIQIADNGEVMFKSPGVFLKYYKNEEATAETKTPDGWVHTGDAGFIDQRGHLRIIDRAKDVGRLNSGALFAPKYLENRIKFFPEVKEAVAFGHGREYVTMFINIDLVSVGNWAERNNVSYASYQELAAHPQVYEIIRKRVDELNKALADEPQMAASQVRRFLILHKELDADDGELTRTQKVRRSFVADRYAVLVKALYDGSKECHVATEMTFEDGRKGIVEGDIRIVDMETYPVRAAAPMREAAE